MTATVVHFAPKAPTFWPTAAELRRAQAHVSLANAGRLLSGPADSVPIPQMAVAGEKALSPLPLPQAA